MFVQFLNRSICTKLSEKKNEPIEKHSFSVKYPNRYNRQPCLLLSIPGWFLLVGYVHINFETNSNYYHGIHGIAFTFPIYYKKPLKRFKSNPFDHGSPFV
ncbi:hypothetical protein BLOT_001361 [Blomia tropicalis]|nr:hypothetical protein BLOT_001361 [Blomia tropicalis]